MIIELDLVSSPPSLTLHTPRDTNIKSYGDPPKACRETMPPLKNAVLYTETELLKALLIKPLSVYQM